MHIIHGLINVGCFIAVLAAYMFLVSPNEQA